MVGTHLLRSLALTHLRLRLIPERGLQLPAYNKGNSLRGGFGAAFRKLVCVDMHWECADCSLRYTCPYTKVFNPFIPPDAPQFSGNQDIPRPFVFKPPLTEQTHYAAGQALVFDLVLVGAAIDYLPYFVVAFRELGVSGFGVNRVPVQLNRVESIDSDGTPTIVYDASTNVVRPVPPTVMQVVGSRSPVVGTTTDYESHATDYRRPTTDDWAEATDGESQVTGDRLPSTDYLELHFLTPTTLKSGSTVDRAGEVVRRPAFHHVLKRLRDRVNALATFYGNGPLDLDFKALGQAAEQVETVEDHTRWIERSRVARRRGDVAGTRYSVAGMTDRKSTDYRRPATGYALFPHDLSGFVGTLTVRGDLAAFLPLLRVGEYVHVGKNAVFGNGWFVVK
jgi:hypothetical protein